MGSCRKEQAVRHEDTLAYLRNLSEGEACLLLPMFRRSGDVLIRYWLEGGEVRSCVVSDAEPARPDGVPSALDAVLSATLERFGDLLPKLSAELGRPVSDLDSIEQAIRDGSHVSSAAALKAALEELDGPAAGPGLRGLRPQDGPAQPQGPDDHHAAGSGDVRAGPPPLPRLRRRPLSA